MLHITMSDYALRGQYVLNCNKPLFLMRPTAKDQDTIENAAYEVHQLPHTHPQPAAVQLQPCAAYGVISSH